MNFVGDWRTTFAAAPPPENPSATAYSVYDDEWDRAWVGCKDANPEYNGIRDYTAIITPGFGLMRVLRGWAYPNLTPANDPRRAAQIQKWDDTYDDGMILPDFRGLGGMPVRRHGWWIEQDDSAAADDTSVPAVLQAAAMMAADTET